MTDADFWNKAAAKYALSPIRDMDAYEATLARVRSYLGPADRALEIGCGTGTTALKLAASADHILATDISPAMIDIARDKAAAAGTDNVTFTPAPADTLPDGPYDAVMAFNLLHLLRDLDGTLAQIAARVRTGGLFLSKTTCLDGPGVPLRLRALISLGLPLMQLFGRAPYVNRLSIAALEEAVARAGFDIIETGDYPNRPSNRFIVARKPG